GSFAKASVSPKTGSPLLPGGSGFASAMLGSPLFASDSRRCASIRGTRVRGFLAGPWRRSRGRMRAALAVEILPRATYLTFAFRSHAMGRLYGSLFAESAEAVLRNVRFSQGSMAGLG